MLSFHVLLLSSHDMIDLLLLPNIAEPPGHASWMGFDRAAPIIPLHSTSSGSFFGSSHLVAQLVGNA
jgi:hypothetical protein